MKDWREYILNQFIPNVSKLSLVSDPDNLLTEEKTSSALRKKGFDILEFGNAIEFRYSYESQYRSVWDKGIKMELVVILHSNNTALNDLPFDLYEAGKKFYFKITSIFLNFSPSILKILDKNMLDALYQHKNSFPKERISNLSTIDFILKYVYKIEYETINAEIDLMKALFHIHYSNFEMPMEFLERIFDRLKEKKILNDELLEKLITQKSIFINYIIKMHKSLLENSPEVILSKIVSHDQPKIDKLLNQYEIEIPSMTSNHKNWLSFALKYASLSSCIYRGNNNDNIQRLSEIYKKSNAEYSRWIKEHFASLIITPYITPAMVHHVPHFIADVFFKTKKKQSLIIIDGLALDQWITLKDSMPQNNYVFSDNALFAWVPTLTSVSRQAIVSGRKPLEFSASIDTTNKEEAYWSLFWENVGLQKENIIYRKAFDDLDVIKELENIIIPSKTIAACFIINKVDNIMHGMEIGYQGFHNLLELYGKEGYLNNLISFLLKYDFDITITSDHGNIDCTGIGSPKEGALVETKGERVRIYKNKVLRDSFQKQYPETCAWKPSSLPSDYFPLLSMGNRSFSVLGAKSISHGSISIQETIVPFIKVERQ
jgi:hypothetical protein